MARGPEASPALLRGDLPPAFIRWRLDLPPGVACPAEAADWAGALVLIEEGVVEVDCQAGGFRRFVAGDLLALGCLPLKTIRNPGTQVARLVAVRRRGPLPTRRRFARVRFASGLG